MPRPIANCTNTSPLVQKFHHLIKSKYIQVSRIAGQAGIGHDTVRQWFTTDCNPNVKHLEAALRTIGYRLEIVKDDGQTDRRAQG